MNTRPSPDQALTACMFLISFGLVLFELALTRIFGVVLFASFAHLALALALLGISFGAMLQHVFPRLVPAEHLNARLAALALGQAGTTVAATWCATVFPLTLQFDTPPVHYAERSGVAWQLIDPVWFIALLPILAVPFTVTGLAFAATFQHRKDRIGLFYGADLLGGAAGALAFVPLLYAVPAPDVVWVVAAACAASATLLAASVARRALLATAALTTALTLGLAIASAAGLDVLTVRYAAGYSEENVVLTKWTPLTRLALHVDETRGPFMLLDNSSASAVVVTHATRNKFAKESARAVVYDLHKPPARIAVLAASAGPEVAVAQRAGHTKIDAIDIAAEIGDIIAARWPNSPVNPYVNGDTRRIWSDGRAAILHSDAPYDIIHMVHANLHSAAGLMSTAWSPNLLGTQEAFETYLDNLTEDGTICFSAGGLTRIYTRAADAALRARGVANPDAHILFVGGQQIFVMVKKRPWTTAERDRVAQLIGDRNRFGPQSLLVDPLSGDVANYQRHLGDGAIMTDDRPYFESPSDFSRAMQRAVDKLRGEVIEAEPVDVIYNTLVLQTAFVLVAGALLVIVPLLMRGSAGLTDVHGVSWGLLYVCGLGYGYLAVETVLIHELVLFVGHPVYAVTVVIFAMLLASGIGALLAQRVAPERLLATLHGVLGAVLVLGAVQAFVVPPLLNALAFGLPLPVRVALTGAALLPLGLVMGMPFPLGIRLLRDDASALIPWAWAFNGWTSVMATLGTMFASRLLGYSAAFGFALAAYTLSLVVAHKLSSIGARTAR